MPHRHSHISLWLLVVLAVVSFAALPLVGWHFGTPRQLEWISPLAIGDASHPQHAFYWGLRLPRALAAFLGGAGLSLAGLAFQAYFRNPLADPYVLGVSSGASFGASLYVQCATLPGLAFLASGAAGLLAGTTFAALAGAFLAVSMIYGFTLFRRRTSPATMLLGGIAVNFLFSSLILFFQVMANEHDSMRLLRWLLGGVGSVSLWESLLLLPWLFPLFLLFRLQVHEMNLLSIGEEFAVSRGVDLRRMRLVCFAGGSLITAAVVAICGPIGFVGLVCPHVCRLLFGPDHRRLVPASVLVGGTFLLGCDTLARMVLPGSQIPLGVVTSLIGAPCFIWLLARHSTAKAI